jgi:hypothetical protein
VAAPLYRDSGVVLRTLTEDERDARTHALVEARKREIEALWGSEGFFTKTSAERQKELADEEASIGPKIEALMAEWEAIEKELAEG